MNKSDDQPVREAHLEAMAEAALGGHELGEWQQVDNGWQAACAGCQATTWVGNTGLRYSLLENRCRKFKREG